MFPTGTVTFLFTDIQGSTPMWEKMPQEMEKAVAQHHAILRKAIESNGGVVSQVIGDAFESAFRLAAEGLSAAIEAQRLLQSAEWGATGMLKVRMGLHTGPAELDPKGDAPYAVSHTLNRTARIMSAGHGGQILLSQETADLVRRSLPEGVRLADLGEHCLKGMEWAEHLYQACAPGIQQDFPPLATLETHPNNLPLQMTSFIGREKEVAEILELLEKNRLVTLTGSGGTGKTRLSLRVAEQILDQFPNGAWLVELAALNDPNLVPRTVLAVLGLQESASLAWMVQLKTFMRDKHLLLVLDNCEHVIADCARLADELLHACPKLKIMASSREALGVAGEIAYHVPSLPAPDPRQLPALEEMNTFAAVRLFIERAASAQPGFSISSANALAVAQICRRLDGIPLAIELAAARVSVLSVEQIAARLNDRFRLLTGGSRTALPRQQTLRASIDWSFSMLEKSERLLLMRLSVFYGGWTLEAANQVCGFAGLDEYEVIDGLTQLARKSLIVVESDLLGSNRYRMLETIRQYAREKLFDSDEAGIVRDQHLDFFMRLAEAAEPNLRGPQQVAFLDRLETEIDNLRLAMEWALEGQAEKGATLASSIFWMWHIRGYRVEGEHWLDLLFNKLRLEPETPSVLVTLAKARLYQSFLLLATGRASSQTTHMVEEAKALADSLGETGKYYQVQVMHALAWNAFTNGQPGLQHELFQKGLAMAQELGDRFLIAEFLQNLASIPSEDKLKGLSYAEKTLDLRKELGDLDGQMWIYQILAVQYFVIGNLDKANMMLSEAQKLARIVNNRWALMSVEYGLAFGYCETGDYTEGIAHFRQALATTMDFGEYVWIVTDLNALGYTLGIVGDWEAAQHYFLQAIEIARENHSVDWVVKSNISYGETAWAKGEFALAEQAYQAAALAGQDDQDHFLSGVIAYGQGKRALIHSQLHEARGYFRQALQEAMQQGDPYLAKFSLEALASLSVNQAEKAAKILGKSEQLRRARLDWGFISYFPVPFHIDTLLAPVRAALGEAEFERLKMEGQAMTMEQAVRLALEED